MAISLNNKLPNGGLIDFAGMETSVDGLLSGEQLRVIYPSRWSVLRKWFANCLRGCGRNPICAEPSRPDGPRLHVGAGAKSLADQGYEDIDGFDSDRRPDYFQTKARRICRAELLDTVFAPDSVAEIRSHHMFEHISLLDVDRTLRGWNSILKTGGHLWLEVPDFEGCMRQILALPTEHEKEIYYRAIFGSQVSPGEFHNNAFTSARLIQLLEDYGFRVWLSVVQWTRRDPVKPHMNYPAAHPLPDLTVRAVKVGPPKPEILASDWTHIAYRKIEPNVELEMEVEAGRRTIDEAQQVVSFNAGNRDRWVADRAATLPPGTRIIDVGAGTTPYRSLFAHCDYKAHDFEQYQGQKDGPLADDWAYGQLDYTGDITAIPVADASFDAVLCTEVLEHVPEPIAAIREMARILRPGGDLFLTAPLQSALHQEPFHFYGGFTPHFYRKFLSEAGFEVVSITANGGLFLHVAQEIFRTGNMIDADLLAHFSPADAALLRRLGTMMQGMLPVWLGKMEQARSVPEFTIGYHVQAKKR